MENDTKVFDFSNRLYYIAIILVAGILVLFGAQISYQMQSLPVNTPQDITVTGTGKVYAKPDIAQVTLGATTESLKSQDAVTENNKVMNAVIADIKALGIEDKDIKTTYYNLSPLYDYTEKGRVFKGYSINQQITLKIRDFAKISDILDKATSNGANTIGDLQFTIEDPDKAQADARAQAIEEAKNKATVLAQQSGLKLIKLINVSEGYVATPVSYAYGKGGVGSAANEVSLEAVRIQTGESEINSTVYLTYRVR